MALLERIMTVLVAVKFSKNGTKIVRNISFDMYSFMLFHRCG